MGVARIHRNEMRKQAKFENKIISDERREKNMKLNWNWVARVCKTKYMICSVVENYCVRCLKISGMLFCYTLCVFYHTESNSSPEQSSKWNWIGCQTIVLNWMWMSNVCTSIHTWNLNVNSVEFKSIQYESAIFDSAWKMNIKKPESLTGADATMNGKSEVFAVHLNNRRGKKW